MDPASLDNLRDIVEPTPISHWPLAPGWWVLIGIVILATLAMVIRRYRRWQSNAYRRAALSELKTVASISEVSAILKRTALAVYSRTDVAALTGEAWYQWLTSTAGMDADEGTRRELLHGVEETEHRPSEALLKFAEKWVNLHGGVQE